MTFKDLNVKLKALVSGISDDEVLREIGNEARQMIKSRTRNGYGVVEDNAPATRLPGLSESYKKQRKRLARQGKLSPDTTPNKSNMTKTGELLDTMVVSVKGDTVTVSPNGKKNAKKAKYNAEKGRVVYNLSKKENQAIRRIVNEKIKTDIKKQGL